METRFAGNARVEPPAVTARVVVVGDVHGPYHPMDAIRPSLTRQLGTGFQLTFVASDEPFGELLDDTALVVSYTDRWNGPPLSEANVSAVTTYVRRGGGLLVLHNGICWGNDERLLPLVGARFASHPEQERLHYEIQTRAPITDGLAGFKLIEEPYRYQFARDFRGTPLLRYRQQNEYWPAGWSHEEGSGRVAVLQPGHSAQTFDDPSYGKLIRRCAEWCARCL